VQNDLLDLGADLSVPGPPPNADGADGESAVEGERLRLRVSAQYTDWLEGACDEVNAALAPLRSFVIPGGTAASAQLHVCRTVCRRAERRAIAVGQEGNPEVVRYLNRLSDLLFILARACNEGGEPLWDPGAHSAGVGGGSGETGA
jgi:cob(I)alamin adenosyltransferase